MPIVIGISFVVALFVAFVLGGVGAWVAARMTRSGAVWVVLCLLCIIPLEIANFELVNLLIAFRNMESGDAPYWDRYLKVVADGWLFWAEFGIVMGVCSWISCLKQSHHFLKPSEPIAAPASGDSPS